MRILGDARMLQAAQLLGLGECDAGRMRASRLKSKALGMIRVVMATEGWT